MDLPLLIYFFFYENPSLKSPISRLSRQRDQYCNSFTINSCFVFYKCSSTSKRCNFSFVSLRFSQVGYRKDKMNSSRDVSFDRLFYCYCIVSFALLGKRPAIFSRVCDNIRKCFLSASSAFISLLAPCWPTYHLIIY